VLIIAALAIVIKAGMRLQGMQRLQMLPGLGLSRRWLTIAAIAGSALMMLTAALDFATALISVLCVVHQEMRE
jgi:TRAP-type C4-dicarboxylate transport system permease small subunit